MSKASENTQDHHEWPAKRRVETREPAPFAAFWEALAAIVDLVPSYRDTAKGRQWAMQVRIGLMVGGVLIVGFAGKIWVPLGVITMALGLLVPMAELKKRGLRKRLRHRKSRVRIAHEPLNLRFDGRRIAVMDGDNVIRRILSRAGEYGTEEHSLDGRRAVLIHGPRRRKRDNIWLTSTSPARDSAKVSAEEIDLLVEMNDEDIDSLLKSQG